MIPVKLIRHPYIRCLALVSLIPAFLHGQRFQLPSYQDFVADTLTLVSPLDSIPTDISGQALVIEDNRSMTGRVIDIRQTEKWKYIPVDQYVLLKQELNHLMQLQFMQDSVDQTGTLHLVDLKLWMDRQPVLDKGLCLNAYTVLKDTLDHALSDWIWEIRVKRKRKEADSLYLGRVIHEFARQQSLAILKKDFHSELYPHIYRRQLIAWSEMIIFQDGYALNAHLTLDFPPDQFLHWKRGSPGVYYRKSSVHESIAIGGWDQQWYRRLTPQFVANSSATLRVGFNNFDRDAFQHLDYQNLMLVALSGQASLDYRPIHHKGFFAGVGIHLNHHILPDVIEQTEIGGFLRMGVILP